MEERNAILELLDEVIDGLTPAASVGLRWNCSIEVKAEDLLDKLKQARKRITMNRPGTI